MLSSNPLWRFAQTGIIGLAYSSLSGVSTPFEHLTSQGSVRDLFTMCLGPRGGTLYLGGGDSGTGIRYTPIVQQSYYVVTMEALKVRGVPPRPALEQDTGANEHTRWC